MAAGASGRWVVETLYEKEGFTCAFRADKVLYEEETGQQHLVIFENGLFGRMMALDGITQVTERDEFIYHEMMAHVPILAHGAATEVLIVGGGDCGMAEEALKHPGIERLTQVEIDDAVVDFSKEHFAEFNAPVFEDERFDLVIADGARFVAETDRRFDVVMVDSTDPMGPGAVLFTEEFYRAVHRCLKPGGVLVTQNGVPFVQGDELKSSVSHFRTLFADGSAYVISCPTYALGFMALGWASDDAALRQQSVETIQARFDALGIDTQYYNPAIHVAAFALPNFMLKLIGDA